MCCATSARPFTPSGNTPDVKQLVLVAERIGYIDRAKEVIYDTLTAAGITIAFPQCDVHLIPPAEK